MGRVYAIYTHTHRGGPASQTGGLTLSSNTGRQSGVERGMDTEGISGYREKQTGSTYG